MSINQTKIYFFLITNFFKRLTAWLTVNSSALATVKNQSEYTKLLEAFSLPATYKGLIPTYTEERCHKWRLYVHINDDNDDDNQNQRKPMCV